MAKITIIDIQHKEFKKTLQGYDRNEVNEFLDEIIETLEDEAQARAALQGEIADLRERLSHFKAMEESLQSTLLLAQRTADEVKAAAHKEADLIKQEARLAAEREISALSDRIYESQREAQRHQDTAEKAKSELRSLLMSHLSLIERTPSGGPSAPGESAQGAPASPASASTSSASGSATAAKGDTEPMEQLPLTGKPNGNPTHHKIVE
jgi:cell division initiation protein